MKKGTESKSCFRGGENQVHQNYFHTHIHTHSLFDQVNLCFDELLSDFLHNHFFPTLLRYFWLTVFSAKAPCARAACESNQYQTSPQLNPRINRKIALSNKIACNFHWSVKKKWPWPTRFMSRWLITNYLTFRLILTIP